MVFQDVLAALALGLFCLVLLAMQRPRARLSAAAPTAVGCHDTEAIARFEDHIVESVPEARRHASTFHSKSAGSTIQDSWEAQQCQAAAAVTRTAGVQATRTASTKLQSLHTQYVVLPPPALGAPTSSCSSSACSLTASTASNKGTIYGLSTVSQKRVAFHAEQEQLLAFPAGPASSSAGPEEKALGEQEGDLLSSQSCFDTRKVLCITAGNASKQEYRLELTLKQEYDGHCYEVQVMDHANALACMADLNSTADIVLLDSTRPCPEYACNKVISAIRCTWSKLQLPIIAIMPAEHGTNCVMAAGANDFLITPVTGSELRARLAMQLALKRAAVAAADSDSVDVLANVQSTEEESFELRPRRSTRNWLLVDDCPTTSNTVTSAEHPVLAETSEVPERTLSPRTTLASCLLKRCTTSYGGRGRMPVSGSASVSGLCGQGWRTTADDIPCVSEDWLQAESQAPLGWAAGKVKVGTPRRVASWYHSHATPSSGGDTIPAWFRHSSTHVSQDSDDASDTLGSRQSSVSGRSLPSAVCPTVAPAWVRNAASLGSIPATPTLPRPDMRRSISIARHQHRLARDCDGDTGAP